MCSGATAYYNCRHVVGESWLETCVRHAAVAVVSLREIVCGGSVFGLDSASAIRHTTYDSDFFFKNKNMSVFQFGDGNRNRQCSICRGAIHSAGRCGLYGFSFFVHPVKHSVVALVGQTGHWIRKCRMNPFFAPQIVESPVPYFFIKRNTDFMGLMQPTTTGISVFFLCYPLGYQFWPADPTPSLFFVRMARCSKHNHVGDVKIGGEGHIKKKNAVVS